MQQPSLREPPQCCRHRAKLLRFPAIGIALELVVVLPVSAVYALVIGPTPTSSPDLVTTSTPMASSRPGTRYAAPVGMTPTAISTGAQRRPRDAKIDPTALTSWSMNIAAGTALIPGCV